MNERLEGDFGFSQLYLKHHFFGTVFVKQPFHGGCR